MSNIQISEFARNCIEHFSNFAGVDSDKAEEIVHGSAEDFLKSAYMAKSNWFKNNPVHSFAGADFKPKGGKAERIYFHIDLSTDEPTVVTPDEAPLDEEYFVRRVLAEAVVDFPDSWPEAKNES